jgi:hypothetical protein
MALDSALSNFLISACRKSSRSLSSSARVFALTGFAGFPLPRVLFLMVLH